MSHPDDETLNAVLDGETGPEERAHVEGCQDCAARLDQLRRAAALVATPVPAVDELRREAAVRQALTVYDGRRSSRQGPPRWAWSAVAAAAVVLVTAIALGQSGDGRDDDRVAARDTAENADDETFAAGGDASAGAGATDVAGESAPLADDAQQSITMAAPANDLGELRDADLAEVLRPHLESGEGRLEEAGPPCDTEARRDLTDGAQLVFVGKGTYDGQPVSVLVFEAPDGKRVARVLDEGCGLLVSQEV